MDDDILNLEQAVDFLGVSEKTLIKLLREEHVPARKIGREWRFSRGALLGWLASGDSNDYVNQNDRYMVSEDIPGASSDLLQKIEEALIVLKAKDNNVKSLLQELDRDIMIPPEATLRMSYKQQRDIEKLEFKIFWNLRDGIKLEGNKSGGYF
ncbi:helix-turn-helix domain-containing protein [Bacillaceae bacterium Marseille-Q3522]|nr:helix-turn-helix domain-containing protein [Bacillaceae bacterium Marseille-Q3522]